MRDLHKAYDEYRDFHPKYYFTCLFDVLASTITLKLPLEASKENMLKVLDILGLSEKEYHLVSKKWSINEAGDAKLEEDYPNKLLYKGIESKTVIWIILKRGILVVDFHYDCQNLESEKKMVNMNAKLRKEFGLSTVPTFNVLIKEHGQFATEKVRTEKVETDLESNYNDDFIKINQKISDAIPSKESGLILLYGKPGTGKTTYIKSLISSHDKANFIFVQNEFVANLLDPDFISFLLKQRNSILVIEDAEKVISSRENLGERSLVSTILQLTDGLFSDYLNIKVICTFNTSLSKIDTALLRKGRLISMYEFNPLSLEKTNKLLDKLEAKQVSEGMSVADIYNFKEKSYDNVKGQKKIGFN